jgi:hypothetical protein
MIHHATKGFDVPNLSDGKNMNPIFKRYQFELNLIVGEGDCGRI